MRHYTTLMRHPAVEVVNYWGLTDAGAWLGAPSGLLRTDGSRKPGYDALRGLVRDAWWLAPTAVRTDADGVATVEGFAGDYSVTARDAAARFPVVKGEGAASVRLGR